MEEFTLFLGVVMLVFGVLQIMLFFKMWGMTNDMSKVVENTNNISNNLDNLAKHVNILAKHLCSDEYIKTHGYTLESKGITYTKEGTKVVFSDGVKGEVFNTSHGRSYITLENGDKRFYDTKENLCAALHEYITNKRELKQGLSKSQNSY